MSTAPPEAATPDSAGDTGRTRPGLPGFPYGPVLIVAGALAAVLAAVSGRYGYHRDELYFLACGQHLAWGYPDQPPFVPVVARLMSASAPGSLVVLRLPSALAAAALVVLTGLIARELGAGRRAQVLAAACVAVAPLVTGSGHLLSTTTFDLPFWALDCWLVIRLLRTGNGQLWLAVGLVTGIGLLNSDLIAFLILGVIVGLAVAGPRPALRSGWLYAGGAIALELWVPYLAWQAVHGWPLLTVASGIAAGASGTSAARWAILPEQLLLGGLLAPVWIAGLVRLLRGESLRWARALGAAWVVLAVVFTIAGGKPYYLSGMYPVLFGAGAQPALDWLRRHRPGRARGWPRYGLVVAGFALTLATLLVTLPLVPAGAVHRTRIVAVNYDAGETIGWPAYVSEIAGVYRSLPPRQRASAIVLTSNYGEAGATQRFGPGDGVPAAAVYSGHMGYWYWGPPPATAAPVVLVGFDRDDAAPYCGSLRLAARLDNHIGVSNDEQGALVWICSAPRVSWQAAWRSLREFA